MLGNMSLERNINSAPKGKSPDRHFSVTSRPKRALPRKTSTHEISDRTVDTTSGDDTDSDSSIDVWQRRRNSTNLQERTTKLRSRHERASTGCTPQNRHRSSSRGRIQEYQEGILSPCKTPVRTRRKRIATSGGTPPTTAGSSTRRSGTVAPISPFIAPPPVPRKFPQLPFLLGSAALPEHGGQIDPVIKHCGTDTGVSQGTTKAGPDQRHTGTASNRSASIDIDLRAHIVAALLYTAINGTVLVLMPDLFSQTSTTAHKVKETPAEFFHSHYHGHNLVNTTIHSFFVNSFYLTTFILAGLSFLRGAVKFGQRWCSGTGRWQSVVRRAYGFLCFVTLFVGVSAAVFGGFNFHIPLIPDIRLWWKFVVQWGMLWKNPPAGYTAASIGLRIVVTTSLLAVDVYGAVLLLSHTRAHLKKRDTLYFFLPFVCAIIIGVFFLTTLPGCTGNDSHWIDFDQFTQTDNPKLRAPMTLKERIVSNLSWQGITAMVNPFAVDTTGSYVHVSKYIKMRDGVSLAADIYLDPDLVKNILSLPNDRVAQIPAEMKLPTFIEVTRYNRRMGLTWPFTMMSMWGQKIGASTNVWNWQMVQALVTNGYAVVVVDTRGTGASTGSRPIDFSPAEVLDMQTIVSWVKAQFWSSGKVAMGGISYDGMTGMYAAAMGGVDAVVALFTPMDVTADLIQPGGLVCSSFVDDYAGLTQGFEKKGTPFQHLLDNIGYPLHVVLGFMSIFGLPAPVENQEDKIADALDAHAINWNMSELVQTVRYKDDRIELPDGESISIGNLGVTETVMAGMAAHEVDLYIVGGYCDSTSGRGASRLFNHMVKNAPTTRPKLVLGPWTHSGRRSCSPHGGTYSCFEDGMYNDIVRYLDCTVKKNCWGGMSEELNNNPVHFFEMASEKWSTSSTFPPPQVEYLDLRFSSTEFEDDPVKVNYDGKTELEALKAKLDRSRGDIYTLANEASDWVTGNLAKVFNPPKQQSTIDNDRPVSYRLNHAERDDSLFHDGPQQELKSDLTHRVDYTATSGQYTRWLVARHPFRVKVDYSNRRAESNRALSFTTYPLKRDAVMAGSSVVEFDFRLVGRDNLASALSRQHYDSQYDLKDVAVFAYLEDVDLETGDIVYVSEGRTLLSHRSQSNIAAVGAAEAVIQPGGSEHHRYSLGNTIERIALTTEPSAHRFKSGHAIRISLTGSDVDNFDWDATTTKVYDDDSEVYNSPKEQSGRTEEADALSKLMDPTRTMASAQRQLLPAVFAHTKAFIAMAQNTVLTRRLPTGKILPTDIVSESIPNVFTDNPKCIVKEQFSTRDEHGIVHPLQPRAPYYTGYHVSGATISRPESWNIILGEQTRIRLPLMPT